MSGDIIRHVPGRIKHPDLVSVLSNELSGSEMNSVMLEVFNERIRKATPADTLNHYQENRFVKPSDLPVLEMKQMELDVLQLCERFGFHPIDLSPVTILGACSSVGPTDQKKILSALRGTEVLADSTNAITLHVCDLKRRNKITGDIVRFSNIQRLVRAQVITGKGFTPHFRVGCLVSCGHDTGGFSFEHTALKSATAVLSTGHNNCFKTKRNVCSRVASASTLCVVFSTTSSKPSRKNSLRR